MREIERSDETAEQEPSASYEEEEEESKESKVGKEKENSMVASAPHENCKYLLWQVAGCSIFYFHTVEERFEADPNFKEKILSLVKSVEKGKLVTTLSCNNRLTMHFSPSTILQQM